MTRLKQAWLALCGLLEPEYRIVRDGWAGYEVQKRYVWFPLWIQCGDPTRGEPINTHSSLSAARKFLDDHASGELWKRRLGGEVERRRGKRK